METHQDDWDVLRLHNEELVITYDGLKELQRDGRVLVLAHATREELHKCTEEKATRLKKRKKKRLSHTCDIYTILYICVTQVTKNDWNSHCIDGADL